MGLILRALGCFLVAWPSVSWASQPAQAAVPAGQLSSQLGQLLLGLGLVILLIFALAWFARRVQNITPRGGKVIQLIASQALGPRDRLLLVQVGTEQVLLGLSSGRIAPLHVLKDPVSAEQTQASTPEFAQRLMELLNKEPKDKS